MRSLLLRRDSRKSSSSRTARSGNQFFGKTLNGWEEIRQALQFVEELRTTQEPTDVRVEVYEHSGESSLKVSFRSLQELDDYLRSRFRGMLLRDEPGSTSRKLDVMKEVQGKFVLN